MEWREASMDNCPVGRALELLGEKWTLVIVRDALNGVRRFEDFRQHVGLSEAVLSRRLRSLVDAGVLKVEPYQDAGRRTRHEYRLTRKGVELGPVVIALKQWGETYYGDPRGPVMEVRHRGCDGRVKAVLRCDKHPRTDVRTEDTFVRPGRGARRAKHPLPVRDPPT